MNKKWLITGGCGFIGTRLIKSLLDIGGNKICVVDNLSVGSLDDLASVANYNNLTSVEAGVDVFDYTDPYNCSFVQGDILDQELAKSLTKNVDVVVHLAANTGVGPSVKAPRDDCSTNVLGTFNYLEGARQVADCKFIFASSGAPIGEVESLPIHEKLPSNPVSPYGASKLAGEGYCSAYFHSFGVQTVALRFGNVYGPGSIHKGSVVAKFIKNAFAGEVMEIYGNGQQTRDFIYIDDLVNAIFAAVNCESANGEKFQIATNMESTVSEMVGVLQEVLMEEGLVDTQVQHVETRTGDVMRNYSDVSKARDVLGWQPQYDLKTGLQKTVSYFNTKKDS